MEGRHHAPKKPPKTVRLPKKWMTCLKCGRRLFTDVNHRFCRRCTFRNDAIGGRSDGGFHVDEGLRDTLGRAKWDQLHQTIEGEDR